MGKSKKLLGNTLSPIGNGVKPIGNSKKLLGNHPNHWSIMGQHMCKAQKH